MKGINQRHNFGSTQAIFRLNRIAEHLALNTLVLRHLRLLELVTLLHNIATSVSSIAPHAVLVSPSTVNLLTQFCLRDDRESALKG